MIKEVLPLSSKLAVIGGSGFYNLQEGSNSREVRVQTPYAKAPVSVYQEQTTAGDIWFIPRHGKLHVVAPHQINYRANLWALHNLGVSTVIAVNAVGGISASMLPGSLVLPDQIIDYTWGREHTFFVGEHALDKHLDFTWPYDAQLSAILQQSASRNIQTVVSGAVYAATQGPRLETAAEIRKMQRDGCDIVGMTGMPEAILARELNVRYACIALVVNKGAGLGSGTITTKDIQLVLAKGMAQVRLLLLGALAELLLA